MKRERKKTYLSIDCDRGLVAVVGLSWFPFCTRSLLVSRVKKKREEKRRTWGLKTSPCCHCQWLMLNQLMFFVVDTLCEKPRDTLLLVKL